MLTTSKWCAYIKFFFYAPLTEKKIMRKKSTKQYEVGFHVFENTTISSTILKNKNPGRVQEE
jgi:hypothetical protein